MREVKEGEKLRISEGWYGEDLNIAGKNVSVTLKGKVDLRGRRRVLQEEFSSNSIPVETGTNFTGLIK